jgi:hypothetical protein
MRITTKAVFNLDGELIHWEGYEYSGPVEECKRDKAKEQATQQMNMMNQLTQQNLATQLGMVSPLVPSLQGMVQNPTGFDPAGLAAMKSAAIQNTGQMGNQAMNQAKQLLASRGLGGGQVPFSGMSGQILGPTAMMPALERSNELNQIGQQNSLAALQNKWQAAQMLGGYAGLFSPAPYVGGAGNALSNLTQLWTAPTIASQAIGGFSQGFGGGLGAGLGKYLTS